MRSARCGRSQLCVHTLQITRLATASVSFGGTSSLRKVVRDALGHRRRALRPPHPRARADPDVDRDLGAVRRRRAAVERARVLLAVGQAVVEDDDVESEPSLFRLSLWDGDASIADDIERDGTYAMAVSCKNLDAEILDLRPMQGLSAFSSEEYEHGSREELLRSMYDVTPIAELEDNLSSSLNDYRLIEATVSYSGLQNARSGSQFGKMLLKDDSTMTMDAIESGENLLLNCITSTGIASRFGKYSRVLALVTAKVNDYGLSANLECAVGLVVVKPPEAETSSTGGDDDSEDDAASYFKTDSNVPTIGADEDEEDDERSGRAYACHNITSIFYYA